MAQIAFLKQVVASLVKKSNPKERDGAERRLSLLGFNTSADKFF